MASHSQIELIAEQVIASRGDTALCFVAGRVKDAADRGDLIATDIWQQVSEYLGLTQGFSGISASS